MLYVFPCVMRGLKKRFSEVVCGNFKRAKERNASKKYGNDISKGREIICG
jgi:hypothetical protein